MLAIAEQLSLGIGTLHCASAAGLSGQSTSGPDEKRYPTSQPGTQSVSKRREKVLQLREDGVTATEIAKELNVSLGTAANDVKALAAASQPTQAEPVPTIVCSRPRDLATGGPSLAHHETGG